MWFRLVVLAWLCGCGRIGFEPPWSWQLPLAIRDTPRTEVQRDVPVLVVLDPTRIAYADAAPDGRDLRFFDDSGTQLGHEIELWDPAARSFIWVGVPVIELRGTTLSLLYGNAGASDVQDAASVWRGHAGVWHFAEDHALGAEVRDASRNGNHGQLRAPAAAVRTPAQIGFGLAFGSATDYVEIEDSDSLDVVTPTFELWVGAASAFAGGVVLSKDGVSADTDGAYNVFALGNGAVEYETNNFNVPSGDILVCCTVPGELHAFAFTIDTSGNASAYVDGALEATLAQVLPTVNQQRLLFGRRGINDSPLLGTLDEIRISAMPRSAEWIALQHASMIDQLIAYGAPEPR